MSHYDGAQVRAAIGGRGRTNQNDYRECKSFLSDCTGRKIPRSGHDDHPMGIGQRTGMIRLRHDSGDLALRPPPPDYNMRLIFISMSIEFFSSEIPNCGKRVQKSENFKIQYFKLYFLFNNHYHKYVHKYTFEKSAIREEKGEKLKKLIQVDDLSSF